MRRDRVHAYRNLLGAVDNRDPSVRLSAKAWMSFSPERRKSKKSTPMYLQVSQILKRTKYSRRPFSVVTPPMMCRSSAKGLTACSALLLFHGTPSYLRKVNNLSRFFSKRSLTFAALSL